MVVKKNKLPFHNIMIFFQLSSCVLVLFVEKNRWHILKHFEGEFFSILQKFHFSLDISSIHKHCSRFTQKNQASKFDSKN